MQLSTTDSKRSWRDVLSAVHMRRILEVLDIAHSSLVGMFDRERSWNQGDIAAVKLLASHLRASCTSVEIGATAGSIDPLAALSPRQLEVAELIGDGLTNVQIADRLFLTEMTVKKYMSRIFEATGFPNRSSLAASMTRRTLVR